MNHDKMISLLKRWRDIEKRQKDLDFERSAWARDLRAECDSDAQFIDFCAEHAAMTEQQARVFLARGAAAKVITDATTWDRLGGWDRQICKLAELPNKRAQVEAIEATKASGKRLATVIRERTPKPDIEPMKVATHREDAAALAKFVLKYVPRDKWTPYITSVVARHADLTATVRRRAVTEQAASARA